MVEVMVEAIHLCSSKKEKLDTAYNGRGRDDERGYGRENGEHEETR